MFVNVYSISSHALAQAHANREAKKEAMTQSPEQTEEKGMNGGVVLAVGLAKHSSGALSCCVMAGNAETVTDWEGVAAAPLQFLKVYHSEQKI